MGIEALATMIVTHFLVPIARDGFDKLKESIAGKAGEAAAEHGAGLAKRAWERVKVTFQSGKERKSLEALEDDPDEFEIAEVVNRLKAKLAEDERLRQELEEFANAKDPSTGQPVTQVMQQAGVAVAVVGSDFRKAQNVIIGADVRTYGHTPYDPTRSAGPPDQTEEPTPT